MSASPTTHITRIAFAIACTIVASLAFTGAAWASPTITKVDGNPTCASVGAGLELYKAEPVTSKSFSRGSFSGAIVVRSGQVFDWSTSSPVDAVIVKGGDTANVYRYTPETTSGTGLHAPVNPSNGNYYGLSHVSFCQDNAPPPPPPAPCTPGGSDTKDDGTPCNPPAPCTPGGSDMREDGTPCTPPPATVPPAPPLPPVTTLASSTAPDVLGVVAELRSAASASMSGPRRCVTRRYTQVLTGRGIRRVTVRVNGRVVRTMSGGKRRYTVSIDPRRYAGGVMRIQARVEYVASSRKRPQTLSATVLRCAMQQTAPQFTG